METSKEHETSLLAVQSSILIDGNMGQSWLDIHYTMQKTIGVPKFILRKTYQKDFNIFAKGFQNRLKGKSLHGRSKNYNRQKRTINNNVVKNQLKIMLNAYNQPSIFTIPTSQTKKFGFAMQNAQGIENRKQNGKLFGNLEDKENQKIIVNQIKSYSSVTSIFNRVEKYQKQKILGQCKPDYCTNRVKNIQIPYIFNGSGSQKSMKKAEEFKQQQQAYQSNNLASSLRKQRSSKLKSSNGKFRPQKTLLARQINGLTILKSKYNSNNTKEIQPTKKSTESIYLSCGLAPNQKIRTIHSLDSLKKDGKGKYFKLRSRSEQRLKLSRKKNNAVAKQNRKGQNKLAKEVNDLKQVKNRLSLNPQIHAPVSNQKNG